MRVIAGRLGGRQFTAPHGHRTHPMSEKMRGALFTMLGDINGLHILDPFAGSGALSFEAISRGANTALAIENAKTAQAAIDESTKSLQLFRQVKLIKANASSWSANNPAQKFDLILADPPYDSLQVSLLQTLASHLNPGGTYVLSWPGKLPPPGLKGLSQVANKHYGDSQLIFFQH